jgi:hypothetical protein
MIDEKNLPEKLQDSALDNLLPKQRLFLMLLLEGQKVYDAYTAAGYDGEKGSAYQMKSRLDRALVEMAKAKNMSKGDLMMELGKLSELPVVDKSGNPVQGISVNHKIRVLALQQKALEMDKAEAPNITAIQINRYNSAPKDVVDTTVVEEPK